jgi:integrase
MYFCGLRPGEARAARWENFDGKTLRVGASMWRSFLGKPKTAASVAPVPVTETLAEILAETRQETGLILMSPLGQPVDLHNLASRVVRPVLARCVICKKSKHAPNDHDFQPIVTWRGWYAFRRGLATLATKIDSQLAAKSLLRHTNIAITQAYYIKSAPEDALRAVKTMDALFHKDATNSVPN